MKLYLEGALVGTGVEPLGAIDDGGMEPRIGSASSDAGHGFDGPIDDLRFYDRALDAAEAEALYRAR